MNKAELIEQLTKKMGTDRRQATAAVENVVDIVVRAVHKGDSVTITGFGVFEQRRRAARVARNPRTGETVKVKPTLVPAFRPGAQFKAVVAGAQRLPSDGPAVKRGVTGGPAKRAGRKAAAKKTSKAAAKKTARKAPGKKAAAKKVARKAPATKKVVKKTAVKKAATKKTAAKKTAAKKTAARKAPAKKAVTKATVRKAAAKKAPAKRSASKAPARKAAAKKGRR